MKAGSIRKKEAAARGFKSKTACKENAGVGPENPRKVDGHPQIAASPQHDESARQRHEKHQDRNDAYGDCSGVTFRRGGPLAAVIAIVAASVAVIASARRWRGAAASAANVFDDDLDIRNCGCARHGESFFILRTLLSRLAGLGHLLRGEVLRHKIFGRFRHAELVSPTIHHRDGHAKIVGGRR